MTTVKGTTIAGMKDLVKIEEVIEIEVPKILDLSLVNPMTSIEIRDLSQEEVAKVDG
jgi:aspartate carbamoyltransferase regulatory subunit